MKKAIAIIVAVLFAFVLTSLTFAAVEKKAEPAKPAEKPKVRQFTGDVKAVDEEKKTVTVAKKVKDKVTEKVFTVDDKTKITMDKEKKALADVKVGDKVKVKYTEVEDKNVAKSIAIIPVEKKEPAKPAEKK